ncbi:MAG: hypothetical protein ABI675_22000 [Chitinophagaceae bacterium]
MHQLFPLLFPEIGDKEARVIHITGPETGIPSGQYPVLEFYCVDVDCDCRQVYLRIMEHGEDGLSEDAEAEISFGWEPREFYIKWFDKQDYSVGDFKGPCLNILMKQGPYKKEWLKLVAHQLKTDNKYVKRLETHYRMVSK